MPTLRELQLDFAAQVYDNEARGVDTRLRTNGLTGARRLQVYRNNHVSSLTEALHAVYPVLHRLVGEEFFAHFATHYLRAHPSRCSDLHAFGAQVPELVAALPGLEALPYMRDVAGLEWSYHEVYHAADHAPLDVARLASIAPPRYGELKFSMHSASRLLESPYPVLRIWQANQLDYDGDGVVDLQSGGNRILVIRRALDVEFELLDRGDHAFLSALRDGKDFATASDAASAVQPDFDVGAALQDFVSRQVVVDFNL